MKRLYKDNCEDDDNATGNSRRRLPECDGDDEVGVMIDYAAQVRYVIRARFGPKRQSRFGI